MNELPCVAWVTAVFAGQGAQPPAVAWPELAAFLSAHYLTPAAHVALQSAGREVYLPEDFRQYLEGCYCLNLERNQALLAQLRELLALLNTQAIRPVVIKGMAALLSGLHEDLGVRVIGDIDLYIPADQLAAANVLLQGAGYRPLAHPREGFAVYDKLHHLAPLEHPAWRAHVELHRDWLAPKRGRRVMAAALDRCLPVRERSAGVDLEYRLLSAEDALLHNLVHGMIQDGAYWHGCVDFRQLLDASALLGSLTPKALRGLQQRAAGAGLWRAWASYLALVQYVFAGRVELQDNARSFWARMFLARQQLLWRLPALMRGMRAVAARGARLLPREWRYRFT